MLSTIWIIGALYGLWTGQRWGRLLAVAYAGPRVTVHGGFIVASLLTSGSLLPDGVIAIVVLILSDSFFPGQSAAAIAAGTVGLYLLTQREYYDRTKA